jgi:DNA-binding transcriptional MerR regulator
MSSTSVPVGALTIDELAGRVGMTVRNLREWKTLGLLPAAEMHGRVGYYDESVVALVEQIQKLHAEGFPLELISRMLESAGDSAGDVMRLADALRAPFRESAPPLVDVEELRHRWGSRVDEGIARACEVGLMRERPDGRLEYTSARVAEIGDQLHGLGLTMGETLNATADIRRHLDAIAEVFEGVWRNHVWEPFVSAGSPEGGLGAVEATVAAVQPMATDAVMALFTVAMEARIEQGIARELQRVSPTASD